jgi:hypothetical protein
MPDDCGRFIGTVISSTALALMTQPDGLYQVTTPYLCAGYVVHNGRITQCAPILRKRLTYWRTIAVRIRPTHGHLHTGCAQHVHRHTGVGGAACPLILDH